MTKKNKVRLVRLIETPEMTIRFIGLPALKLFLVFLALSFLLVIQGG